MTEMQALQKLSAVLSPNQRSQTQRRQVVLHHLQCALRELYGYEEVELRLEENSRCADVVCICYKKYSDYEQCVNIQDDSELCMMADILKAIE